MIDQLPLQFVSSADEIRFEQIVLFGLWGATYNLAAYGKSASKTGESWNPRKASRTLFLGLLAGGIVAITDPDGGITGAKFETAMAIAVPLADQLASAWNNLTRQIDNNQFGEWSDDWFEDGRPPQAGDELTEALEQEGEQGDEMDYFDAIAPDDLEPEDDAEAESETAGGQNADGDGDGDGDTHIHESA